MLRLHVKGNHTQATAAAERRGVTFLPARLFGNEAHGFCPDSNLDAVIRWFCEDQRVVEDRGFPVGTLLWYSPAPDSSPFIDPNFNTTTHRVEEEGEEKPLWRGRGAWGSGPHLLDPNTSSERRRE